MNSCIPQHLFFTWEVSNPHQEVLNCYLCKNYSFNTFSVQAYQKYFLLSKKTYNISGSTLAPPTLPVAQYQVGDKTTQMIPPKSFWTSQFNQPDSKFVKFNLTVQDNGVFGIYGRRGASPSIAQFDFFDIVDGRTLSSRVKRSAKVKVCSKHC